jgi:ElaB/YqjD/DUF883 family membrane-anchored ribosome-binding protein
MSSNQDGDQPLTSQAQEKVQQSTQQAATAAARYVRDQTETRSRQLAAELGNVAGALNRSSHALHADGNSNAARSIELATERVEGLGRYLGSTGGDQMLRDLEAFGRRKPWGMVGLGIGVGLAASRFLKASSSRRAEAQFSPQPSTVRPPQPAPTEHVTGEIPVVSAQGF